MIISTWPRTFLALAVAAGLGVAGATAAIAGNASYDASLADKPCDIVTSGMVATLFNVPAGDLEQVEPSAGWCHYGMEAQGKSLEVTLSVVALKTDKAAAEAFGEATRSKSRDEMAADVKENFIDEDDPPGTFEKMTAGLPDGGLQFEDVERLGDQARFETTYGTLVVQRGNLLLRLSAYYGPHMPMPDAPTMEAMTKADAEWTQRTIDERLQMATELAKAALAGPLM